jgi:guanylate kinase
MAEPVHLEHRKEFQELLADYKLHISSTELFRNLRFVVLSGVAGGGRNTVINHLVKQHGYYFIISDTTRPPKLRDGALEQNGVQYWFRSEQEMLEEIRDGEFLEAELIHNQQVSGTSLRELQKAVEMNRTAIAEVEYGGANHIAELMPNAHIIGLLPPSYEEWLRRFKQREVISNIEFHNRLETAAKVLSNMLEKPYFQLVINDNVEACASQIERIVHGAYDAESESKARVVAQEMLANVEQALQ